MIYDIFLATSVTKMLDHNKDDLMKDIRTVEKNAEEVNILKKMTRHIAETFVEEITIYDSEKIEIRFVFDDLLIGMADRIKKKTEDIA